LVPDKKSYKPGENRARAGDVARDKVICWSRLNLSEVITVREIDSTDVSIVIDVPIDRKMKPNVYLGRFVRERQRHVSQSQSSPCPRSDKMLKLGHCPNRRIPSRAMCGLYDPGAQRRRIAAQIRSESGIVDEAIYSIHPRPPQHQARVLRQALRRSADQPGDSLHVITGLWRRKPADLAKNKSSYQLADFKNESSYAEPTIRKEFQRHSVWQTRKLSPVATAKRRSVSNWPDNLTTVARDRAWRNCRHTCRIGRARKRFARKDVIMRLEMPRFLD